MNLVPRSGSTDVPTYGNWSYWQRDTSQGINVCWASGTSLVARELSEYTGFSIPGFHRRVRSGELLPHTPWSQYHGSGSGSGSIGPLQAVVSGNDIDDWWSEGNYPLIDSWISPGSLVARIPSGADALVQEAASRIMGESMDALTFLAELASTKKMFLETGRRFLKKQIPRNWRQLSNDWLSYRYGWRTFMYDCKDLHKAVARLDEKRKRYSKRARSFNEWSETEGGTNVRFILGTSFSVVEKIVTTYKVELVGTVNADVTVPAFSFNPAVTAWEVIPYSFIVDWFVGVGTAISALSFLAAQRRYAASWGCRISAEKSISLAGTSVKPGVTGGCRASGSGTAELVARVPCSVPIAPQLTFKLDTRKVIDLLALVKQRI